MIRLQTVDTSLVNFTRKRFGIGVVEGWRTGSWLGPQGRISWNISQNTIADGPALGIAISATNRKLKNQGTGS